MPADTSDFMVYRNGLSIELIPTSLGQQSHRVGPNSAARRIPYNADVCASRGIYSVPEWQQSLSHFAPCRICPLENRTTVTANVPVTMILSPGSAFAPAGLAFQYLAYAGGR